MKKIPVIILALVLLAYGITLVRTAWLSDDAYITFRTVDNFVNGYGLRWNTHERVQAYTHPLWMFLMSAFYFFTREIFYTSMIVSIVVSLAAVVLFSLIPENKLFSIVGVGILTFSRAFVDYSTSGLENPLTFFLLALFFVVYFKCKSGCRKLFFLSLIAGLGATNRADTILLFLPLTIYSVYISISSYSVYLLNWKSPKTFLSVIAGFSPLILWEMFSVFYYGFLLPNTYYAKLNTGIPQAELLTQGLKYIVNSVLWDPISISIITLAILVLLLSKKKEKYFFAAGMVLYLLFVVKIGGDFMSGRYIAAPLFYSVIVLSRFNIWRVSAVVALAAMFLAPSITVLSDSAYDNRLTVEGIADERGYYYQSTGLLKMNGMPVHPWAELGKMFKEKNSSPVAGTNTGFTGFYSGPGIILIDQHALSDPLLARLPASYDPKWRIGHFTRAVPEGYLRSLKTGRNEFKDENLGKYYDVLSIVTQGELFSLQRFKEIVKINLGFYDNLVDSELYRKNTRS